MAFNILFKNGIVISTWLGVCIDADEECPFWSLDDESKLSSLQEARAAVRLIRDVEGFENILTHCQWKRTPVFYTTDQEEIELIKRCGCNPYASDEDKESANLILKSIADYSAREITRRRGGTSLRDQVIQRDHSTCRYCGTELKPKEIHIDHIIPYSLGGLTEISNLASSCVRCNLKKAGKTLEQADMVLLPLGEQN
jgi:hypothetical protein